MGLRHYCIWLIFGFALVVSSLYGSQLENANSTSVGINIKNRDLERQLHQNLEKIAFSSSHFDAQNAMDFLIDHPELSLSPLVELLSNPHIPLKNLLNIWNIAHYISDDLNKERFSCKKVDELISIQKKKQMFLVKVVDDYLTDCKELKDSLYSWMDNPSVLIHQEAFSLIQKHHLIEFAPRIVKQIALSTNPTRQEMGLSTLLALQPKSLDIHSLLPLFRSSVSTVRYKTAHLFAMYSQPESLMDLYSKSSHDLEKSAIVVALIENPSDKVFDFIINNYLKNPGTSTEMERFFLAQTKDPKRLDQFLGLLQKATKKSEIIGLLNTTMLLIPNFSNDKESLLKTQDVLKRNISSKDGLTFDIAQKIQAQIYGFLKTDFSTN